VEEATGETIQFVIARQLLEHETRWRAREDLRIFAEWHGALGTDPEVALREMRERLRGGGTKRR
jgi:hypothetical protein